MSETLNLHDFEKVLSESSGSGVYDICFPSIRKEPFRFKQLTVGQQRSISKNSTDIKDKAAQISNRIALLKVLCLDDNFNPENITWAEFVKALAEIRDNNFTDPLELTVVCQEKKCGHQFPFTYDISEIVQRFQKICEDNTPWEWSYDLNGHKITFMLKEPTVKNYLEAIKSISAHEKEQDIQETSAMAFIYSYIYGIKLDGKNVDISKLLELPIWERMKKFETMFKFNLVSFLKSVKSKITRVSDSLTIDITCPKCGHVYHEVMDVENFFIG